MYLTRINNGFERDIYLKILTYITNTRKRNGNENFNVTNFKHKTVFKIRDFYNRRKNIYPNKPGYHMPT